MENKIQNKIIKKLEADGWYVLKLIKTNKNGIPDLIAIKQNQTIFVEVKQPKGKISPVQDFRIKEIQGKGINVQIWTDYNINFKQ